MKINAINIKLDLEQKKKTGLFETNEFLLRGKIFLSAIRVFFRRGSDTGEDLQ